MDNKEQIKREKLFEVETGTYEIHQILGKRKLAPKSADPSTSYVSYWHLSQPDLKVRQAQLVAKRAKYLVMGTEVARIKETPFNWRVVIAEKKCTAPYRNQATIARLVQVIENELIRVAGELCNRREVDLATLFAMNVLSTYPTGVSMLSLVPFMMNALETCRPAAPHPPAHQVHTSILARAAKFFDIPWRRPDQFCRAPPSTIEEYRCKQYAILLQLSAGAPKPPMPSTTSASVATSRSEALETSVISSTESQPSGTRKTTRKEAVSKALS